jgi:hypothetical protein
VLTTESVRLAPAALVPGKPSFQLEVVARQAQGVPARMDRGKVAACVDPDHPDPSEEPILAWIILP